MANLMPQSEVKGSDTKKLQPILSIILVCWNNKAYLDPCLKSLYDSGMKYSFEVIVVDNGSTDGSLQILAEKYPDVKVIQNSENVGLGKASNQGIEATCSKYVLLLNNDTVVNGLSFDIMVDFLEQNPKTAAVGGKIFNSDGTVQTCYNHFPSLKEEFLIATRLGALIQPGFPAIIDADEIKSVDWMSSACLMLRRSALNEVGLLDDGYFIYGDETDLQYRIKKAGWKIYYLPKATIIHYGGRSLDRWKRRKLVYRGKMLFYRKNYGKLQELILRSILALLSIAKLAVWGIVHAFPSKRNQANKEFRSNLEVVKLCFSLA